MQELQGRDLPVDLDKALRDELKKMADAVVGHKPIIALHLPQIAADHLSHGTREAEYANTMASLYKLVESILVDLPA